MAIFLEVAENKYINERHAIVKDDNLTNTVLSISVLTIVVHMTKVTKVHIDSGKERKM